MSPLADREEAELHKTLLKFVMFGLGAERYAVPVLKVKEIIAVGRIFPLPKMPAFIEGIISLRGDIIPIVDLRKRFDLPEAKRTDESRIVVIEMENFYVGILVDLVYEVIKIDEDLIEPPPPLVGGLKADYLEGVCELDRHLITILNLKEIFSSSERVMLAEAAGAEEGRKPSRAEAPGAKAPRSEKTVQEAQQPAAVPKPAPKPGISLAPAEDVTIGQDGKFSYSGRNFYLGKSYAGKALRVEPAADGVVVKSGGETVKKFRI